MNFVLNFVLRFSSKDFLFFVGKNSLHYGDLPQNFGAIELIICTTSAPTGLTLIGALALTLLLVPFSYPEALSSVPIWLDDLECTPEDTNLRLCRHAGTGLNDCQHSNDVILSCIGGKPYSSVSVSVPSIRALATCTRLE